MHPELSPGKYITCCGGQRGFIILCQTHRILIMRFHEDNRVSFVCGSDPAIFKGEVQWSWGHYFTPYGSYSEGMALSDAAAHYKGMPA